MRRVYKYPLEITDTQSLRLPAGAEVLHVGFQGRNLMLWARVDPEAETVDRWFCVAGTGHSLPKEPLLYLGTVFHPQNLVFHVFEMASPGDGGAV
jgi:hypothetical protein